MTWTNTIGFIGLQGSPMIATDSPRQCAVMLSATKHHAKGSEASAVALATTQVQSKPATDSPRQRTVMLSAEKNLRLLLSPEAQSKPATDSPRQRAVMLSAAKHLRLLLSRLRRSPNPPQILPANAPSC